MIRPAVPSDTPALVALAQATGVFKPIELEALQEVFDDYHDEMHRHGHRSVTSLSKPLHFAEVKTKLGRLSYTHRKDTL